MPKKLKIVLPFVLLFIVTVFVSRQVMKAPELLTGSNSYVKKTQQKKSTVKEKIETAINTIQHDSIHYVAIGDSLTEGVGDTNHAGGFVSILASSLSQQYTRKVDEKNYGVSGETSTQILKRIKENKKIQKDLKDANFVTLTVGGNDILKVVRNNVENLKVSNFDEPHESYEKRLTNIIKNIRKQNEKAPIYILGVYNPYYLNFPDLTDLQTIIDQWNDVTKKVAESEEKVHFVPINDLLYKGVNGKGGVTDEIKSSDGATEKIITNDALSETDNFHPNDVGYKIMSDAVEKELIATDKEWENIHEK
jgi:lysophospholipase L1-like esterase